MVPDDAIEALREFSKAVFGSKYRLEVAAAVASLEVKVFYARQLARELVIGDNQVGTELEHFARARFLRRLGAIGTGPAVYYERQSTEFWNLALSLQQEACARLRVN